MAPSDPQPGAPSVVWQLVRTDDGSPTLRHTGHGEACHSSSGAWLEARERYAAACRLRARALADGALRERGALRLLDVGTGLGLNLAAALEALDGTGVALEALSLELDRGVIERTLAAADAGELGAAPAELVRWHAPVRRALGAALERDAPEGAVPLTVAGRSAGGLTLLLGDGRETLAREERTFDAVFLDAFSPRVDPALWELGFLRDVAARMAPGSWLSTYTVSLAVRARLVASGLRVGPGASVGAKRAGTLARPALGPNGVPGSEGGDDLGHFDARTASRIARRAQAEPGPRGPISAPRLGGGIAP